jgi:hypothetical protein
LNRLVKYLLAIVIVIAVPKLIQKLMFGSKTADPSAAITQLAKDVNATLPKKIDAVTTLTKVELDGSIYRIHYQLDPAQKLDVARKDTYTAAAVAQICGSNMKMMLDNQITIEYLYSFGAANNPQQIAISIPPGSCR